jgi:phosphate transport system substrate-binding protein
LRFDGPTLAGIFSGSIREWDSAQIKALNPGEMLPHHTIIPIRRADASSDTFIFSQFLEFSTPSW